MEIGNAKFELSTLRDEAKNPFAVILYELRDSQQAIDLELIKNSASCIFQSEGNHTVFIKDKNGTYFNCPVTVSIDQEDSTRLEAKVTAEPLECSVNLVEVFRENATTIESTSKVLDFTRER